jgi:lysozyme family protein
MADFKPVLVLILKNEGGWVDDPDDNGGETWQGVARNYYPNWKGWAIIDRIKKANPKATAKAIGGKPSILNTALYAQTDLKIMVAEFYEALYWDVNKLDFVKDQQLAQNVCDCGVNCGTSTGARMLQRAYNLVRYSEASELVVDGKIGNSTLTAINSINACLIYEQYNVLRKAYYDAIIARKPSQIKFKKSWYSRIIPYK